MEEIWKDIEGYENEFQVSNTGKVKRLSYLSKNRFTTYFLNESIKKQTISPYGYYCLSIKRKLKLVHRLIAIAFIPNPENKPDVNHIDGDKLNNSIENLEWCTKKENNQHAYDIGLKEGYWKNKSGDKHHSSKKVIQHDLNSKEIKCFGSISEASRISGFSIAQISRCCNGKIKSWKGFKWEFNYNNF